MNNSIPVYQNSLIAFVGDLIELKGKKLSNLLNDIDSMIELSKELIKVLSKNPSEHEWLSNELFIKFTKTSVILNDNIESFGEYEAMLETLKDEKFC